MRPLHSVEARTSLVVPVCRKQEKECKMGIIQASSATVASLYITFLAFGILCIRNFVPANGPFEIDNFDYGTAFLLLSLSGLLSGEYWKNKIADLRSRLFTKEVNSFIRDGIWFNMTVKIILPSQVIVSPSSSIQFWAIKNPLHQCNLRRRET